MSGVALVLVFLLAGWLLRRMGRVSYSSAQVLTRVVVDVALPALTFRAMRGLVVTSLRDVLVPVLSAWVGFAVVAGTLVWVGRARGWSKQDTGALVVVASVGNTAFVGLPLIEGLFGRQALATATLVDQGGSFFVVSTASVMLAAHFAGKSVSLRGMVRSVFLFAPMVGAIAGLLSRGHALPSLLDDASARLAALVIPLALMAVGLRMRWDATTLRTSGPRVAFALALKLIVAPAAVLAFARALGLSGEPLAVTVAQCGMAPMVTAGIIAMEYGLSAEIASALVALGLLVSLPTVSLWALWLR
ncbi:MAG: AEC family transporter [Deltaproteobacteria bacterium]|nr:AEC family transporter [Deltaproteobacteria bacterium]